MDKVSENHNHQEYLHLFLQSRVAMNVTESTLTFYQNKLGRFLSEIDPDEARRQDIEGFLAQLSNPGNRHAYFRAIRTFFKWREEVYNLPNPTVYIRAPRLPKKILPTLEGSQVSFLIEASDNVRDKAIIALFVESGLRLSELANIQRADLDLKRRLIRVKIKGQKEGYAAFGDETQKYLVEWLKQRPPTGDIWGLARWGIVAMLKRLRKKTGLPCNPHVFRRTFACLLRERGVDVLAIKDLGRWEQATMVEHYTRSIGFMDSLKFYRGPIS